MFLHLGDPPDFQAVWVMIVEFWFDVSRQIGRVIELNSDPGNRGTYPGRCDTLTEAGRCTEGRQR